MWVWNEGEREGVIAAVNLIRRIQGDMFVEVDTCSYEATSLWWEMIPTSMRRFTPPGEDSHLRGGMHFRRA